MGWVTGWDQNVPNLALYRPLLLINVQSIPFEIFKNISYHFYISEIGTQNYACQPTR